MSPTEVDVAEREARIDTFVREVVIPFEADPRNAGHGPEDSLVRELRELARAAGLLTPQRTEDGKLLSHRDTAPLFRAAGYSPLGPVALNIMAPDEGNMYLLERVASDAHKARFLAPLIAGVTRSAFLMTEPDGGAGSDPSMLQTTARQQGGEWIINGRKTFSSGAEGAAIAIVMARTGSSAATMFLVDLPNPGVRIERILDTIDAAFPGGHAVIRLEELHVPAHQVLGAPNEGFRYAPVRLAPARLPHCMRWWGAARRPTSACSA
jgi:acyl-CoA dehydrogenase